LKLVKAQGKVIGTPYKPPYSPGMGKGGRITELYDSGKNKLNEISRDSENAAKFGQVVMFIQKKGNEGIKVLTMQDTIAMQDEVKKQVEVILASQEVIKPNGVKQNPNFQMVEAAALDTEDELTQTLSRIIPETTSLELANMISSSGRKAAIDLTMAQISSSKGPPKKLDSPVAEMLVGDTGDVPREKLAYQALGLKSGRRANIDSKFRSQLRSDITKILGLTGKNVSAKHRYGQLPFIDNHVFITPYHINDFRAMIAMYHLVRANNAPYVETMLPGLPKTGAPGSVKGKGGTPVNDLIDFLMPSPDSLFRGQPVGLIRHDMGIPAKTGAWEKIENFALGYEGLAGASPSIAEKHEAYKAAQHLLRMCNQNRKVMADEIAKASTGVIANHKKRIDWRGSDEFALGLLPINEERPLSGKKKKKPKKTTLYRIAGEPILLKPPNQLKSYRAPPDASAALMRQSQYGVVGILNTGFTLPPIGWDRNWMIPMMVVIDEYWDMLAYPNRDIIEIHDLLYLIGIKAVEMADYNIPPREWLLIMLLLGIFEVSGKHKKTKIELFSEMAEKEFDTVLSRHVGALTKLKGEAPETTDLKGLASDFKGQDKQMQQALMHASEKLQERHDEAEQAIATTGKKSTSWLKGLMSVFGKKPKKQKLSETPRTGVGEAAIADEEADRLAAEEELERQKAILLDKGYTTTEALNALGSPEGEVLSAEEIREKAREAGRTGVSPDMRLSRRGVRRLLATDDYSTASVLPTASYPDGKGGTKPVRLSPGSKYFKGRGTESLDKDELKMAEGLARKVDDKLSPIIHDLETTVRKVYENFVGIQDLIEAVFLKETKETRASIAGMYELVQGMAGMAARVHQAVGESEQALAETDAIKIRMTAKVIKLKSEVAERKDVGAQLQSELKTAKARLKTATQAGKDLQALIDETRKETGDMIKESMAEKTYKDRIASNGDFPANWVNKQLKLILKQLTGELKPKVKPAPAATLLSLTDSVKDHAIEITKPISAQIAELNALSDIIEIFESLKLRVDSLPDSKDSQKGDQKKVVSEALAENIRYINTLEQPEKGDARYATYAEAMRGVAAVAGAYASVLSRSSTGRQGVLVAKVMKGMPEGLDEELLNQFIGGADPVSLLPEGESAAAQIEEVADDFATEWAQSIPTDVTINPRSLRYCEIHEDPWDPPIPANPPADARDGDPLGVPYEWPITADEIAAHEAKKAKALADLAATRKEAADAEQARRDALRDADNAERKAEKAERKAEQQARRIKGIELGYEDPKSTDKQILSGRTIETKTWQKSLEEQGVGENPHQTRMYKEHKITKIKGGYAVPKFKKKFKLLKHAKAFIDSKTDGRRRTILEGYTCPKKVKGRTCGGLLFTWKSTGYHVCNDCGEKWRFTGDKSGGS
jgi:hypothetical protein